MLDSSRSSPGYDRNTRQRTWPYPHEPSVRMGSTRASRHVNAPRSKVYRALIDARDRQVAERVPACPTDSCRGLRRTIILGTVKHTGLADSWIVVDSEGFRSPFLGSGRDSTPR